MIDRIMDALDSAVDREGFGLSMGSRTAIRRLIEGEAGDALLSNVAGEEERGYGAE